MQQILIEKNKYFTTINNEKNNIIINKFKCLGNAFKSQTEQYINLESIVEHSKKRLVELDTILKKRRTFECITA